MTSSVYLIWSEVYFLPWSKKFILYFHSFQAHLEIDVLILNIINILIKVSIAFSHSKLTDSTITFKLLTYTKTLTIEFIIIRQQLETWFISYTHSFTFIKIENQVPIRHNFQPKRTVVKSALFSLTWFSVRIISS